MGYPASYWITSILIIENRIKIASAMKSKDIPIWVAELLLVPQPLEE